MVDPPTCYVCYDDAVTDELLLSPCGECKMHVHRMCLDRYMVRASTRDQCALVQVTEQGEDKYVVYGSCTVCKRRFEYESETLVSTLRQTSLLMRMLASRFVPLFATVTAVTTGNDTDTGAGTGNDTDTDTDTGNDTGTGTEPTTGDDPDSTDGPTDHTDDTSRPPSTSQHSFATAIDVVRALPPDLRAPMRALLQVVDASMHTMTPDEMVAEWKRCLWYLEWAAVVVVWCGAIGAGVVLRAVWG